MNRQHPLWFLANGIQVFPIKHRDKVPVCASWDDYRATQDEIYAWSNYGVALGALGVVDSDSPEVEQWVTANVPPTPFMVKTARGVHRYYRLIGAAPHFIHRDGHTIEFRNHGQYVVGPGSMHSSGIIYEPVEWSWRIQDVPFLKVDEFGWEDRPSHERGSLAGEALIIPPTIKAGERHELLFKFMRSLQARGVEDVEQLLSAIRALNAEKCSPPIDDAELTRYIRRVAKHRDRAGFDRAEVTPDPAALAGDLIEQGAGVGAAIAAAKAVDPTFDPSGEQPSDEKRRLEAEVARLEEELREAKAQAAQQLDVVDESSEQLEEIDEEEIK